MYWLAREGERLRGTYVQRFEPLYWTVNFPRPMMAAVTTSGADGLGVTAVFYNKDDLAGLIWDSQDTLDHPLFRYATNRDYRGLTLRLRWQSHNVKALDALWGPTLTIEGRDAGGQARSWYVRLWNYAVGSSEDAVITLDFDALDGGFLLPGEADPVYAGDIDRMFISLVPEAYDGSATGPLAGGAVEAIVSISDIVADGNTGLELGGGYVTPHGLNIANGYDDTFNQTPERLVRSFLHLGYRGRINHYVGMSHYFRLIWNSGEDRFAVDPAGPLNAAAVAWHTNFLAQARVQGFEVICSLSFEILAQHMPLAWRQLAHDGAPALTGWEPPSALVSPANGQGLAYLETVFLAFAGLLDAAGLPVLLQLGEPWWWVDPSNGVPYFYDAAAKALYTTETGQPVPAALTSIHDTPDAAQQAYVDWLGGQLGAATLGLRDALKSAHPAARAAVLIYTPQILIDGAAMARDANLPAAWAAPAFDFVQLEDYDHVIAGDWARHRDGLDAMQIALGYAPGDTEYFSGFILNAGDEALWANIDEAIADAGARGYGRVYLWAYSQAVRDGFTFFTLEGEDVVSGFHEVRLPAGIAYGATGGPGFSTQVVAAASGFEQRNANWQQARARYTVGMGLVSEVGLHELIAFFRARRGRAYGFRFKDWSDFTSGVTGSAPSPVDQVIGVGDGASLQFPLVKTYASGEGGQVRPITKPVAGTVRIALDAVEQASGWTVDAVTGIVTFDAPPAEGEVIQAGFEFDVPVRFDTDVLDLSLETFRAGAVPQIPIIEIRQA
jgi:uncharacterized protein (TIGR02217 family)